MNEFKLSNYPGLQTTIEIKDSANICADILYKKN